jgi:hypothetical protein
LSGGDKVTWTFQIIFDTCVFILIVLLVLRTR